MTAVRARQHMVAVLVIGFGVGLSSLAANELNDSIQAFHRGDYQVAHHGLSQLVQSGAKDARVHYYRGLISFRTGDRQAAAADFQTAMHLESTGHTKDVGESLQRVQGHERLVIEKYRAMARLAARQRVQPIAPPPRVQVEAQKIQLATVELPTDAPLFRLASEVPIRMNQASLAGAKSMVADKAPARPTVVSATPTQDAIEPVGTGVAATDDPFADADSIVTNDFGDTTPPSAGPKASNVMGSVFRALFRANVPNIPALTNTEGILPPGMVPGAQPDGFDSDGFESEEEPMFGDEPTGDDDPFGDL